MTSLGQSPADLHGHYGKAPSVEHARTATVAAPGEYSRKMKELELAKKKANDIGRIALLYHYTRAGCNKMEFPVHWGGVEKGEITSGPQDGTMTYGKLQCCYIAGRTTLTSMIEPMVEGDKQCTFHQVTKGVFCNTHLALVSELAVKPSTINKAGDGLFVTEFTPEGTNIGPYTGDIHPATEHKGADFHRVAKYSTESGDGSEEEKERHIVNAKHTFNNVTRYINAACLPELINCEFYWNKERNEIGVRTNAEVKRNGELLIHYGRVYWVAMEAERDYHDKVRLAKARKMRAGNQGAASSSSSSLPSLPTVEPEIIPPFWYGNYTPLKDCWAPHGHTYFRSGIVQPRLKASDPRLRFIPAEWMQLFKEQYLVINDDGEVARAKARDESMSFSLSPGEPSTRMAMLKSIEERKQAEAEKATPKPRPPPRDRATIPTAAKPKERPASKASSSSSNMMVDDDDDDVMLIEPPNLPPAMTRGAARPTAAASPTVVPTSTSTTPTPMDESTEPAAASSSHPTAPAIVSDPMDTDLGAAIADAEQSSALTRSINRDEEDRRKIAAIYKEREERYGEDPEEEIRRMYEARGTDPTEGELCDYDEVVEQ